MLHHEDATARPGWGHKGENQGILGVAHDMLRLIDRLTKHCCDADDTLDAVVFEDKLSELIVVAIEGAHTAAKREVW